MHRYNFYDPGRRLGGFARIGNPPNERHAEMTLCLYLPDGRVAFMFARPEIAEGLTERRWGDRIGYGWSEYLDHLD